MCKRLSVYLSVIPSRFVKNGNIFGIKSDRLTKLAPLVYLVMNPTVCPRVGVGSRNRTVF